MFHGLLPGLPHEFLQGMSRFTSVAPLPQSPNAPWHPSVQYAEPDPLRRVRSDRLVGSTVVHSPVAVLAAAVAEGGVLARITRLSSASTGKRDVAISLTAEAELGLAAGTAGCGVTATLAIRTTAVAVEGVQAGVSVDSSTRSVKTGDHCPVMIAQARSSHGGDGTRQAQEG